MSDKIKKLKPTQKVRRGDFIVKNGVRETVGECYHGFFAGNFVSDVFRPSKPPPRNFKSVKQYKAPPKNTRPQIYKRKAKNVI